MIQSKMNKLAWRQHFPIISLWEIFICSRAAKSIVSGPIWPEFELVQDFMNVLVSCKYKKDQIENNREKVETSFPHFKSMGAFCCHGNQSFDLICPKPYAAFPPPVMLHIKFDQDWPTGVRDIQILKVWTTDGWRTTGIIDAHLVRLQLRWAEKQITEMAPDIFWNLVQFKQANFCLMCTQMVSTTDFVSSPC